MSPHHPFDERWLEGQVTAVLKHLATPFLFLDSNDTIVYSNEKSDAFLQEVGIPRTQSLGGCFWSVFDALKGSCAESELSRVREQQVPVKFEVPFSPLSGWLEITAYPCPEGVGLFYRDVTERKLTQE